VVVDAGPVVEARVAVGLKTVVVAVVVAVSVVLE
jgi:hypothetical protein